MFRKLRLWILLTLILGCLCSTSAQTPVSFSLKAPLTAAAGQKFDAEITASIDGGWHIYSLTQAAGGPTRTTVSVGEGPFKMVGGAHGPAPHKEMDANFQIEAETYTGSVRFAVPVTTAADRALGNQILSVAVRYQACTNTTCLPPRTAKLSASILLNPAVKADASPSPSPTATRTPTESPTATPSPASTGPSHDLPNNSAPVSEIVQDQPKADTGKATTAGQAIDTTSLLLFLWTSVLAGAISLLTPCVFPMVPITVSYFTNHAEGRRSAAVRSALTFAAGIIATFTILGLLLAALFGAAGINRFAANPYVNLLIAALFITFALSLLGAFELRLPWSVTTKLDNFARRKEGGKTIGVLLMGLVFTVTSFTCTAPLVGGLLVLTTQGSWVYPVIGMLVFSTVFALPFFILALAPQLVSQLPRSGGWMNSVKVVMGFLEIAAAMKFISNMDLVWGWGIFTRDVVLVSWIALSLLIVLYLLGIYRLTHDSVMERIGTVRVLVTFLFLSLSFYLFSGLLGRQLGELESYLPPPLTAAASSDKSSTGARNDELTWITNDISAALTQAKAENKPIFIDFTGYTCTNCRWMEINMFPRPAVQKGLSSYVLARLYTDGEGEPYEGFQKMQEERFGTVALPLYATLAPDGTVRAIFPGLTRNEDEFLTFLTKTRD